MTRRSTGFDASDWRTSRAKAEFSDLDKRWIEHGWFVVCPSCHQPKRPNKTCDECYIRNHTWGHGDTLEHLNKWIRSRYPGNPPRQTVHYLDGRWCHLTSLCGIRCGLQPGDPIPASDDMVVTCSRCSAIRARMLIEILPAEREHTGEWFAAIFWMGSLGGFVAADPKGRNPRFTYHDTATRSGTILSYIYTPDDTQGYDRHLLSGDDSEMFKSISAASPTLSAARTALYRHFRVTAFEEARRRCLGL